ncbi:MAG TPA: hypothetical protein VI756_07595 [Blastocatellia bacterium]
MDDQNPQIIMEEVNDPGEVAEARLRREFFDRNFDWFRAHALELYAAYRGKCICVSGQEAFAADTPEGAIALAETAHPNDFGSFVQYIPAEKSRHPRLD